MNRRKFRHFASQTLKKSSAIPKGLMAIVAVVVAAVDTDSCCFQSRD